MSRTPELIQARPVPRPSVWIWAGIVLLFAALFIYGLFTNENYLGTFLKDMRTIAPHVGVVGGGEQYRKQHVNQTMVCAVFE